MFEDLHSITLEMKSFLSHQCIICSCFIQYRKHFFFFSQQKYIHKRMESSSPSEQLERCALSRAPNQQSRRIVDIPISMISLSREITLQDIQHVVHLLDLSIYFALLSQPSVQFPSTTIFCPLTIILLLTPCWDYSTRKNETVLEEKTFLGAKK